MGIWRQTYGKGPHRNQEWKPLLPPDGLYFPISSKGSFYMNHPPDRTAHIMHGLWSSVIIFFVLGYRYTFIHSFTHSFIHSFIHSLIHSFIHSFYYLDPHLTGFCRSTSDYFIKRYYDIIYLNITSATFLYINIMVLLFSYKAKSEWKNEWMNF